MEAPRTLSAEEERRKKLQEYLAAKGKLKPQNNQKPYLRDSTNLQHKRHQPPKQVAEKKDVPFKGSRYGSEVHKNTISNTRLLQNKTAAGKWTYQQNAVSKKTDHKAVARNPAPCARPVLPGQAQQSKNINMKDKLHGRKPDFTIPRKPSVKADIGLTVVLTKSHLGDQARVSDVHLVGITQLSEFKGTKSSQPKDPKPKMLHRSSEGIPVKKSQTLTVKQKPVCLETNNSQPAGKAKPPKSAGHIRIVSRVNQASDNGTPTERSFLIKSSRSNNLQTRHTQTVCMDQIKSAHSRQSCALKPNTMAKSTTTSATTQNKLCRPPPTKAAQCLASTSNKTLTVQSRRSISKPAVWQKSTRPGVGNRTAARTQTGSTNLAGGTNCKPGGTSTTNKNQTSSSSRLPAEITSDTISKPQTPKMTVEDRRKQLQEWLCSKGKTYKRPPMTLPPKRPPTAKKKPNLNLSVWEGIEEEEELLLLSQKISQTLSECLELIDKGVSSEDIHAALDKIPEGQRFAKYWVCKAKLLEREGIFDVVELYKQGVQCGATPIDELREVIFDIMKNTTKKSKAVTFGPLPNEDPEEEEDVLGRITPAVKSVDDMETSCFGTDMCDQGSAVKFQIACLSSRKKKNDRNSQEWKCLTPVRRSVRIHLSASQYPEVVQEHDTVVGSLDELLDMADTEAYLYVRNEALPEEADHTILSMVKDGAEDQNKRPV